MCCHKTHTSTTAAAARRPLASRPPHGSKQSASKRYQSSQAKVIRPVAPPFISRKTALKAVGAKADNSSKSTLFPMGRRRSANRQASRAARTANASICTAASSHERTPSGRKRAWTKSPLASHSSWAAAPAPHGAAIPPPAASRCGSGHKARSKDRSRGRIPPSEGPDTACPPGSSR